MRAGPTAYRLAGPVSGADDAATIVFVHGVGMSMDFWDPQVAGFATTHRVIAYDVLGHGASAAPPDPVTLEDLCDQLLALVDGLAISRFHLVGHSLGALIALRFGLDQGQRLERLVALNGVYERTDATRDAVRRRADAILSGADITAGGDTLERWFGAHPAAALAPTIAWVKGQLGRNDRRGYGRLYRLFADADRALVGRLGDLSMPALFLTGGGDPNSTPTMSEAMAHAAPHGTAITLDGERHMMSLANPARINTILRGFLTNPVGGPGTSSQPMTRYDELHEQEP